MIFERAHAWVLLRKAVFEGVVLGVPVNVNVHVTAAPRRAQCKDRAFPELAQACPHLSWDIAAQYVPYPVGMRSASATVHGESISRGGSLAGARNLS